LKLSCRQYPTGIARIPVRVRGAGSTVGDRDGLSITGAGLACVELGTGNATVTLGGGFNDVTGNGGTITVTDGPNGCNTVTFGNGNNVVEVDGTHDAFDRAERHRGWHRDRLAAGGWQSWAV
jgi:hypothetical protein